MRIFAKFFATSTLPLHSGVDGVRFTIIQLRVGSFVVKCYHLTKT